MSEQGWREFLAADGVDDWVVLHGGATAVFKVGSIGEAARLAAAVAEIDGFEGSGALLTIVDASLTVRLTRGPLQLESRHVDLARAVSKVASAQGAVADRASVQEVQLAIASKPDVDPLGHGSTVWMQELDEAKPLRHAMHVDVSVARDHVEGRLAAALAAGGRVVWESEEHWTLADRAGNRVCITAWPDGATKAPPDPA
jgi:4a-hydroxytetrahydrobiopterin dehydratase